MRMFTSEAKAACDVKNSPCCQNCISEIAKENSKLNY